MVLSAVCGIAGSALTDGCGTPCSQKKREAGNGIEPVWKYHKLLETVFTEDCRLHYGAYDHPARFLIDSWHADQPSHFLMTHHVYSNIAVRFYGAERARSITYFFAHHRAEHEGQIMDEMVRGRYLDRLAKRDGRWRFAERTIVFDWSKIAPADKANWWDAPSNPAKVGAHGPADPAWRFLEPEAAW